MQLLVQLRTAVTVVFNLSHLPPWRVLSQALISYSLVVSGLCEQSEEAERSFCMSVCVLKKNQLENMYQKLST